VKWLFYGGKNTDEIRPIGINEKRGESRGRKDNRFGDVRKRG